MLAAGTLIATLLCALFATPAQAYLPSLEDLNRVWKTPTIEREPLSLEYTEILTDSTERHWRFALFEHYWTQDFYAGHFSEAERTYRNGLVSRRKQKGGKEILIKSPWLTFDELLFSPEFDSIAQKLSTLGLYWQNATLEVDIKHRRTWVWYGSAASTVMVLDRESWRPVYLRQQREDRLMEYRFSYDRQHRYPRTIELTLDDRLHILERTSDPRLLGKKRALPFRYRKPR